MADEATSHYLNQWWEVYWRIYASLGLNELNWLSAIYGHCDSSRLGGVCACVCVYVCVCAGNWSLVVYLMTWWCPTYIHSPTTTWDNGDLGWRLLSRFPPFCYFPDFLTSPKYMLAIEYHIHIWQVSPQLSCNDTCQIWMRFKECSRYFCEIARFAYGEIDERSFSNPHPWATSDQLNPQEQVSVKFKENNNFHKRYCIILSAKSYPFFSLLALYAENPPVNSGF